MPELPEVETIKLGLSKILPGQQVLSVDNNWKKSFPNSTRDVKNFLINATILNIKRRAKVLIIELNSKYSLVIHLKMTGQLVYQSNDQKLRFGAGHPTDSLVGKLPDKSTHVTLILNEGRLFFNDQRKFGWMRLLPSIEVPNIDFFKNVGPEPLEASFTDKDFIERLQRRINTSVKAALLDQTVIAGVGNIYADESLWAAKIHPANSVITLTNRKLSQLYDALQTVLRLSIKKGGSTDKNFVDANGRKGTYLTFAKVFRREGLACPRCGTIIVKIRVAGRGTHICPRCQVRNTQ